MRDFRDGVLYPNIIRVNHRLYALQVRQKLVLVFGVEIAETRLD